MFALDTHEPNVTSADGVKIWAAQAGRSASEAPTIVFIPGFASSSLLFDHQFRDEELLSKYCLITYEPRAQGRSGAPSTDDGWSSLNFARDFEAVCAFYGATKVFFAGWSAGCTISCDIFGNDLGHLVAGLIYLAGMPYMELFGPVNFPTVSKYYYPLMAETNGDTHGPAIGDFVSCCVWKPNRANMTYTFRSALIGTVAMAPTTIRTDAQTKHKQDPAKLLAAAGDYEVVFVVGDEEEVVMPDKMIAKYKDIFPRLDIVRVPGSGHTVFWERPAETKKAIVDFIERVTKA